MNRIGEVWELTFGRSVEMFLVLGPLWYHDGNDVFKLVDLLTGEVSTRHMPAVNVTTRHGVVWKRLA